MQPPWKKLPPLFQQPHLKVQVLSSPPFWKSGRRFNAPSRNGGEGIVHYAYASLFFNKVADLGPAILLKKRLWHRRFLVNFMKFLSLFYRKFLGHYFWLWWKTLCWKTKFIGNLGAYCINLINMKCWVKVAVWNPLDWEFNLLINRS